jgi:hypothetical protein
MELTFENLLLLCKLYLSALILLIAWFIYSKRKNFRRYFTFGVLLLMLIQSVIGYTAWPEDFGVTSLGRILLFTSPLWLTGPLLLIVPRNKVSVFLVPLLCIVLSTVASSLCVFLLLITNQVPIH